MAGLPANTSRRPNDSSLPLKYAADRRPVLGLSAGALFGPLNWLVRRIHYLNSQSRERDAGSTKSKQLSEAKALVNSAWYEQSRRKIADAIAELKKVTE